MMSSEHRFLALAPFAISFDAARERIAECLHSQGVDLEAALRLTTDPTIRITDRAGQTTALTYSALLVETQRTGVVPEIDRLRWSSTHGRGTIAAATDATNFPPLVAQSGVRQSKPLEAPGFITTDVVYELLVDVLHFRTEAAAVSFMGDQYRLCFRAYRAYLAACISSVDAWLNERAWYRVNDPSRNADLLPTETQALNNRNLSLVRKLESWPQTLFRGHGVDKSAGEWLSFDRIRRARNDVIHVNEPEFTFSLRRAAEILNECRNGVGGLLAMLHVFEGTYPAPGVLAIQFAPEVLFTPK